MAKHMPTLREEMTELKRRAAARVLKLACALERAKRAGRSDDDIAAMTSFLVEARKQLAWYKPKTTMPA